MRQLILDSVYHRLTTDYEKDMLEIKKEVDSLNEFVASLGLSTDRFFVSAECEPGEYKNAFFYFNERIPRKLFGGERIKELTPCCCDVNKLKDLIEGLAGQLAWGGDKRGKVVIV